MKTKVYVAALGMLLFLSACSPIEDTKNTLAYVNDVEDYMNEITEFANDFPEQAEQAITDENVAASLEKNIEELQKAIDTIEQTEAPELIDSLHAELVQQNEALSSQLVKLEESLEKGALTKAFVQDQEFMQTINDITSIYNEIENLGE
ncbi:hypothetical protein H9655_00650 [Cytobacillus sp. Sa5YUA1]|uniref:Lipoprotein n=1 Tax=Cytobacillus stercorigallinarum TaxID=2762240 RepID=A0ABR8QJ23_9BACI|nr:DUF6376 family protein [Cytobacillus stercorigallinarum]MBD7935523.1 hypothetical protein [Cytobacillus stercorigallinarum]